MKKTGWLNEFRVVKISTHYVVQQKFVMNWPFHWWSSWNTLGYEIQQITKEDGCFTERGFYEFQNESQANRFISGDITININPIKQ